MDRGGTDAPGDICHAAGAGHFTGKIDWIEIDIDEAAADADHLISPEERLHLAMARQ